MNLAAQYLYRGNVEGVRKTLAQFNSDDELSKLRGFEWYYHNVAVAPPVQIPTGMAGTKDVRYFPDGTTIAVATKDGLIRLWDVQSRTQIGSLESNPLIESLAVSGDGEMIATGSYDGQVRLWSVSERELLHSFQPELGMIGDLEFLKGSPLLAIATISGRLMIFDTETKREIRLLETHNLSSGMLAQTLVSGGRDRELKLWDADSGEPVAMLYGHRKQIFCIDVSPDGKTIASGGLQGDLRIWRSQVE